MAEARSTSERTAEPASSQGRSGRVRTRDGGELFLQCIDGPGPTVVFEAGSSSTRSIWGTVQPRLRGLARAVSYDRRGLGRSAPASGPRRLSQLADDLIDLLDGEPGSTPDGEPRAVRTDDGSGAILVGHSWGGPIVRLAASRRPDLVAGLVLVDPADEECPFYHSRIQWIVNGAQRLVFPPLARIGVLGPLFARSLAGYPGEVLEDIRREAFTPTAVRTQIAEAEDMSGDLHALAEETRGSTVLPLTVISAGTSKGVGKKTRRQLASAHRSRSMTSEAGRFVTAADSAHLVMHTEPGLIAEEIRRMIERLT